MNQALRNQILEEWAAHGPRERERKSRQTPPEGVKAFRDLSYEDDGDWRHRYDVFVPEHAEGPLPLIIDVHGGGWMFGTKELNEYYCMALASDGFAVADINYTLVPDTTLVGQLREVVAAWNWIGAHAAQVQGDASRIFVTGDSAGAMLVLLACAVAGKPDGPAIPPIQPRIQGMFLDCPVSCLHEAFARGSEKDKESIRMILGADPADYPYWNAVDPTGFLPGCTLPPLVLFTTTGDAKYGWQAVLLHQYLEQYRIPHRYLVDEHGLGHVFNVLNPQEAESRTVNHLTTTFFRTGTIASAERIAIFPDF